MKNLVTIDFETYYDKDYSLSKMTTEAYIRDPRFEVIGVGVKVGEAPTDWFSGDGAATHKWLHAIDWADKLVLAHNAMFDGAIMSWKFGIRPKLWVDTLSMARPRFGTTAGCSLAAVSKALGLGEKGNEVHTAIGKRRASFSPSELLAYGGYCKNDVELCRAIFLRLMRDGFPKQELLLVDETIRMFTEPVLELDTALLTLHLQQVKQGKADSLRQALTSLFAKDKVAAAKFAQDRLNGGSTWDLARALLMSNDRFADMLRGFGVEPPTKVSAKTGKTSYAFAKTDKDFTDLLEHEDEHVQAIVAARLDTKSTIAETRAQRFLDMSVRGAFPIPLNYSGAFQTWRWSGGDKQNLQNLPRGGTLRKAIRAPKGHKIVAVDSSNIELRVNHTLAGQLDSVQAFREGRDLYCEFASILFGRPITKADKAERQLGKLCIAEGELVLTDAGLVPIEQVTTLHRVWDGVEWVSHDGAVLVGEKEVMTYEGVTATPDHIVYLRDGAACELTDAAKTNSRLAVTGDGRAAVRLDSCFDERLAAAGARDKTLRRVRRLRSEEVGQCGEPAPGADGRLSEMQPTDAGPEVAVGAGQRHAPALHEPERPRVQALRSEGDKIQLSECPGCLPVDSGESGPAQRHGAGPLQQQRTLRSGEFALGDTCGEREQQAGFGSAPGARDPHEASGGTLCGQHTAHTTFESKDDGRADSGALGAAVVQTKRRVWDILNAGPRHRFTVSGKLVSNCHLSLGYGCGWQKFANICRLNGVLLSDEEAQRIVKLWRDTYRMIPKLWRSADNALAAIYNGAVVEVGPTGLVTTNAQGLRTPPEHQIIYAELHKDDEEGWTYLNRRARKKVYGGSIVENICQHLARNIIADQWLKAAAWCKSHAPGWRVVLQVHDEIVLVGPEAQAERVNEAVIGIMSRSPSWWPEVPLAAEGGIGDTYGDAH